MDLKHKLMLKHTNKMSLFNYDISVPLYTYKLGFWTKEPGKIFDISGRRKFVGSKKQLLHGIGHTYQMVENITVN